jgi:hypothetical protein
LQSRGGPYILGNYELNCVLQVPGLCITKLLDLFMLQDTRSAKLMCDERDLCQMLDCLHLLESLGQRATVERCPEIAGGSVMISGTGWV